MKILGIRIEANRWKAETKMEMPFCFSEELGKWRCSYRHCRCLSLARARSHHQKGEETIACRRRKRIAQSLFFFALLRLSGYLVFLWLSVHFVSAMQVEKKRRRRLCHLLRQRTLFVFAAVWFTSLSLPLSHSFFSHFSQHQDNFVSCSARSLSLFFYTPPPLRS